MTRTWDLDGTLQRGRRSASPQNRITACLVAALVASGVVVSIDGASPVSAMPAVETVFDTPDPDPATRIRQPRDITSIVPARLLETRSGPNEVTVDGRFLGDGPLADDSVLELDVIGRGVVPDDAIAVMLNVTAVKPTGPGYLAVFPCGEARPQASSVNYRPGDVVPNAVLAKLGSDGTVCVYTLRSTELLVDVTGFVSGGSGTTPLVPARLLETRRGDDKTTVDSQSQGLGRVDADSVLQLPVLGRGGVPADAAAVMLNVTAVAPSAGGYMTVFPCGERTPTASNLNFGAGDVVANAVLAKVGVDGEVCIYSLVATDIVVDVNGYFATNGGTASLTPARLLETRAGSGLSTIDGVYQAGGVVPSGGVVELQVAGRGGVPDMSVGAAMLNVTAVAPTGSGYLTVSPCGQDRPTASSVNYTAGDVVPNAVLAQIGNGGTVCIFASTATHVVVDVTAWFDLPPNQPESDVTVLEPSEFVFRSLSPSLSNGSGNLQLGSSGLLDADAPLEPNPEMAEITTDTASLSVGDKVVVTKPSGEPYYGRVTEKGATSVMTEQVALAEVMPAMDVSLEVDTDAETVKKGDGGESVRDVEVDKSQQKTTGPQPSQGTCGADAAIDISASASANAGRFVFDVSLGFLKLNSARIGYNPSVSASATITATASFGCHWEKTLVTRKLPTIKFFVGPIPVWITQEVSVGIAADITATASGSRTLTATAEAFVGITYEDGQWDRETSISFDVSQDSEADIQIDASLSVPTITYSARAYGIVGFDATVAGVLRLEVRPLAKKYVRLTASIDVEVSLVVELDLKLFSLHWSKPFINATLFGPIEIWSLEQSVADCATARPSGLPEAQCDVLVDLWQSAGGTVWTDAAGWVEDTDPCFWEGVVCSGGNIVELRVDGSEYQRMFGPFTFTLPSPRGVDGPLPLTIGDLVGLQLLRAGRSTIESIPTSIGELSNLTELDLTQAGLTSVPSAIGSLSSLEYLDLASNELTSVPPTIGNLAELRELYLIDNPLTTLPRQVGNLGKLVRLDVRAAELTTVPSTVNELGELVDLWLDHNPLTSMPYLGDLQKLEVLFLAESNLTELPGGIGLLESLTYLDASRMQLTSIPDELGDLPSMNNLFLYDNDIIGDITEPMRRLQINSPNTDLDLGQNRCLTISIASVRAWVASSNSSWNDGC